MRIIFIFIFLSSQALAGGITYPRSYHFAMNRNEDNHPLENDVFQASFKILKLEVLSLPTEYPHKKYKKFFKLTFRFRKMPSTPGPRTNILTRSIYLPIPNYLLDIAQFQKLEGHKARAFVGDYLDLKILTQRSRGSERMVRLFYLSLRP